MKFSINIEVDLSDEELLFLKTNFLSKRGLSLNIYVEKSRVPSKYDLLHVLEKKSVISIDNIGNSTLTQIGNKILDLFDRDIKIDSLLNE